MLSELPPSPDVVITAEDVEGFEPCGKYKPYQEKFSSGRRVFKHESEEYFLYGNLQMSISRLCILGSVCTTK